MTISSIVSIKGEVQLMRHVEVKKKLLQLFMSDDSQSSDSSSIEFSDSNYQLAELFEIEIVEKTMPKFTY